MSIGSIRALSKRFAIDTNVGLKVSSETMLIGEKYSVVFGVEHYRIANGSMYEF